MKKLCLCALILASQIVNAEICDRMIMLKQGFFYPQDRDLRCMFSPCGTKGGYFVEGALRYAPWISCSGRHAIFLEVNGSYFKHEGTPLISVVKSNVVSTQLCEPTTCDISCECFTYKLPTFGFGIDYMVECCDCVKFLMGGGLKGFFVRLDSTVPYIIQCEKQSRVGGFAQVEFIFDVCHGVCVDIFAEYLGATTTCPKCIPGNISFNYLKLSGVAVGLGIGYQF